MVLPLKARSDSELAIACMPDMLDTVANRRLERGLQRPTPFADMLLSTRRHNAVASICPRFKQHLFPNTIWMAKSFLSGDTDSTAQSVGESSRATLLAKLRSCVPRSFRSWVLDHTGGRHKLSSVGWRNCKGHAVRAIAQWRNPVRDSQPCNKPSRWSESEVRHQFDVTVWQDRVCQAN